LAHKLLIKLLNNRGPKVDVNDGEANASADDAEFTVRYSG
jgi:hypothetical protein